MKKYIPINCDYYDELEALAVQKKKCEIVFRNNDGTATSISGVIKTFFIRDKAEFLLLTNGKEIRLDQLIIVDGKILPQSTC